MYAVVAAVVVTDLDPAETRKLALPRIVGTGIGGIVGGLATLALPAQPLAVVPAVIVPMAICRLVGLPGAAKVAGYVAGIILLGFSSDPWVHARDRLVETLIGILAALALSLVPVLRRAPKNAPAPDQPPARGCPPPCP